MPTVETIAIAAQKPDGSVVIHQIVGAEPTPAEIAQSLNRAGLGDCTDFARVALDALPDRSYRDAWVLKGGAVVVDPDRIVGTIKPDAKPDQLLGVLQLLADEIAALKSRQSEDTAALNEKLNDALRASVEAAGGA